jgi:H+/Cl- antiporter ClcA
MSDTKHVIPIWFFIGILLTIYGVLILGAGLWDVLNGIKRDVVMAEAHAAVWWGILLLVIGGFYSIRFRPGKN